LSRARTKLLKAALLLPRSEAPQDNEERNAVSDIAVDLGRPTFSQRFGAAIYDRMAGGMEKRVFGQLRRQLLEAA
jgi:hypothetical protein